MCWNWEKGIRLGTQEKELLKSSLTIKDAVNSINRLEANYGIETSANLVKWKSYAHQVVIESDAYFYKIYESLPNTTQMFDHKVRECLAILMQDSGVDWKLISFERDGQVFDFEQRQKLKVATPGDYKFEDILLSLSETYEKVEEMLNFNGILDQLHRMGEFTDVAHLKLTRQCVNKYEDYALLGNQVILLDDADFYIAPADDDGNIINVSYTNDFCINFGSDEYVFTKLVAQRADEKLNYSLLDSVEDVYPGWFLLPKCDAQAQEVQVSFDEPRTDLAKPECAMSHLVQNSDSSFVSKVEECSSVGFCDEYVVNDLSSWPRIESEDEILESSLEDIEEACLYSALEELNVDKKPVWLITSLNPNGKLLQDDNFVVWMSHMKTINSYYPQVKKMTKIFLTQEFCEFYVKGKFNPQDFMGRCTSMLSYVHPASPHTFPTRRTFKEFLLAYAKQEPSSFQLILQKERKNAEFCSEPLKCFSDSNACMLRDFEQVWEFLRCK